MNYTMRYIPHADAARYRRNGWKVSPLNNHHGTYSMLASKKATYRHRSAISGQWVSAAYAKRHPRTTVRERIR